jgi:hypothetical protein
MLCQKRIGTVNAEPLYCNGKRGHKGNCSWTSDWQQMNSVPQNVRQFIFRCIKELDYTQSAEHISQCSSSEGAALINEGMKMLGLKDLSMEKLAE